MATTDQTVGLPVAEWFRDIEVPEFPRKYVKRQGPASTKGGKQQGRTFSASGPKADLIAKMIFADMGLTRTQMATIAKCSPSRVSEVIWALEDAERRGIIEEFPKVPQRPPVTEAEAVSDRILGRTDEDIDDEDAEDHIDEVREELAEDE